MSLRPIYSRLRHLSRFILAPLLVAAGSSCALGFLPNPADSNQAQGMMNALLVETDAATTAAGRISLGGTTSGLLGSGLQIQDTETGEALALAADGSFTFASAYGETSNYNVTIAAQPTGPHQTCAVSNGSGTIAGASVSDVQVACTTNSYTVGGTVTGLSGTGLVLQNNGGDNLAIAANGAFAFATSAESGQTFSVSVFTQPTGPTQTCNVSGGAGTVVGSNVTGVTINCATNTYTIGGNVSGLAGSGLVLRNNGGDDLAIGANGAFAFSTAINSGAGYNVTVHTQPTVLSQTCIVSGGSGTVAAANVTGISVTCTTNNYTIGGTVTGFGGGTGLVLRNNGGDDLAIGSGGAFAFATSIASGGTYNVTIHTQPSGPTQTCNVSGGSGSVTSGNITGITINCVTNTYTVSGTVSGMAGSGLQLRNNGVDNQPIGGNGGFSFSTPVASGAGYNVTVFSQPTTPWQTCNVTNGSGTIGAANVTNVTITCVTNTYTVGGTVAGFGGGSGLVLVNNGGDDLAIGANGGFTFAPNYGSLAAYNVTVKTQPTGPPQICSVSNGTGTLTNSNVTNVSVTCVTQYTLGGTVSGLGAGSVGLGLTGSALEAKIVNAPGGAYTFGSTLVPGNTYNVAVTTQPGGGVFCTVFRPSGTIAAANVLNIDIVCESAPPPTVNTSRSIVQSVIIAGQGPVATVAAGASFTVNLNFAVDDLGTTNVSPVIIGVAGDPKISSYEAFCGIGTYTGPAAPVFNPGNGNLTAPTQSGVYFIRAWNSWDFCSNMTPAFTTQGTTIGIITVP